MEITPNPAFEVDFRLGGDKTRQAVSKYISSKAEIYEYLNQLEDGIAQAAEEIENVEDEASVTFKVNGEEI
jgi:chaperonin cofactor prefoldin